MRKFTNSLAATLFAGAVAATGFSGQASAQPAGGTERFTIISTNGPSARVIATGAFTAVGTVALPPGDGTSGQGTFTFPTGTITLTNTDNPGGPGDFNPVACVGHFSGTGTYVIDGGTGAFSGISGNGTYQLSGTVVSAHTPTGCSDAPIAVVAISREGGPVSFS